MNALNIDRRNRRIALRKALNKQPNRSRKVKMIIKTKTYRQLAPRLSVADTGTALGRGVYTQQTIPAGQIVEVCPVVLLDLKAQPFPGTIRRLLYNWSKTHAALALGYGSLYNHSDRPNLSFKSNHQQLTITFNALNEIQPGEQLTISYDYLGPKKNLNEKSWFEIHKVEKIKLDQ